MIRKEIKSTTHLLINHIDGVSDTHLYCKVFDSSVFYSEYFTFQFCQTPQSGHLALDVLYEVAFRFHFSFVAIVNLF